LLGYDRRMTATAPHQRTPASGTVVEYFSPLSRAISQSLTAAFMAVVQRMASSAT
jgi:hypothetical protein